MSYCARTSLPDTHLRRLIEEVHPSWQALGLRLRRDRLSYEHRVILTLRYLRQGVTQHELAEEYATAQTTVSKIIREVLPMLGDQGGGVLTRYSSVLHDLGETMGYLASHGASCLLDGTLIEGQDVRLAGHLSGKYMSAGKNVQVVSDLGGQALWCGEPLPGATNDSRAARETGVVNAASRHGVALMCDMGYSGEYALVPFRKPRARDLRDDKLEFNKTHSSLRSAVERSIRRIKTWRLLHRRGAPSHLLGAVLRLILVLESRRLWW